LRDRIDDAADRGLELGDESLQLLAPLRDGACLRGLLVVLQSLAVDRIDLEDVDGACDRADLVGAAGMPDRGLQIAGGELGQCLRDRPQRLDAAMDYDD
jgi:hypothetical protein